MKNKIKYLLIASVLTCSVQIAAAEAEEKVVHVLNWSDYIDEEVLTNFY